MNTNFHFLNNEFPTLSDRTQKAEKLVITDPRTSLIYCRMALEEAVNYMYANDEELETQFDTSLHNLLVQPEFKAQFNHKLYNELFIIKKAGNLAVHNKNVSDVDAHNAIEAMFYFSKWFAKSYAKNEIESIGLFNFNLIPKEGGVTLSRKEIEDLQEKLNRDLDKYQEELKEKDKEQKKLAEENELYKKQIELLQSQIEQNKKEANKEDQEEHPRNETDTRKYLIDVALREAGWDLQGANDKEFKVTNMPTSTNTSGTGYVDYVLWGDDGLPLALVEAKSTLQNATKGENQAQLYADALEQMYGRRPVMYYTNGYQTYLWDDQFYKQARLVHGFYTKAELETLMY
ncbi:MAG TPA: restriction endonuclease, partial [Xanthomarina gelatinilytica]|nr:restriction endonuclease [Xanthomarina gelatinilytica]